jgi:hypothetical protein
MAHIEFADNIEDLSSVTDYVFNFLCNRCKNGYQSNPVPTNLGMAGSVLKVATGLFNKHAATGVSGGKVQKLLSGPSWERALADAANKTRPCFIHCAQCDTWVCRDMCWNPDEGVCKSCAPIPGEDEARAEKLMPREWKTLRELEEREARAEKKPESETQEPSAPPSNGVAKNGATVSNGASVSNGARADASAAIPLQPIPAAESGPAACPTCGAAAAGGKFCSECGANLKPKTHCTECGSRLSPSAKFCAECGAKT